MSKLQHLIESNRAWAENITKHSPDFFKALSRQQAPEYLWIGCSDSRVPANEIVGLRPGELFVHRNIANVVVHADLNCLSVIQFAVDVLKVRHIIVCGHYGCSGVAAASSNAKLGLADNWLRHVQDIKQKHLRYLSGLGDDEMVQRMCEINVIEQVINVCQTTIVQDAWDRGQILTIHGWIYGLQDGLLRELGMQIGSTEQVQAAYEQVMSEYNK